MNRRTLTVAVIATLAVVAVGLSAATLTSTLVPEDDGVTGDNSSGIIHVEQPTPEETNATVNIPSSVGYTLAILLVFAFVISVLVVGVEWRRYAKYLGGLVVLLLLVYLIFRFISALWVSDLFSGGRGEGNFGGDGFGDGDGTDFGDISTIDYELLAALGIAVFVFILYRFRASNTDERDQLTDDGSAVDDADEMATFIDRTDRPFEDTTPFGHTEENDVYRAWREMTAQLDVPDPGSTTPGEFATAAVEAGMEPQDVDDLTRLFEEVRYGGREPTETREQQALDRAARLDTSSNNK